MVNASFPPATGAGTARAGARAVPYHPRVAREADSQGAGKTASGAVLTGVTAQGSAIRAARASPIARAAAATMRDVEPACRDADGNGMNMRCVQNGSVKHIGLQLLSAML